jgi:hypothetical protein
VGIQKHKDRCKCGQSTNLGALTLKTRWETNCRRIYYEQGNRVTDYYGGFENEKNFHKKMVPRIVDRLPEMSASHFIWSFTQCRDVS